MGIFAPGDKDIVRGRNLRRVPFGWKRRRGGGTCSGDTTSHTCDEFGLQEASIVISCRTSEPLLERPGANILGPFGVARTRLSARIATGEAKLCAAPEEGDEDA